MTIAAVVLAGGRSSRFGAPKLEAELDGRPILALAIEAVAAIATETLVVLGPDGPDPPAWPLARGVRIVRDRVAFGGPLAGLAAALDATEASTAIVVGGDMPRLRPAVLEAMLAALDARDAPRDAVSLEAEAVVRPLPLAIRVGPARAAAAETLASGQRSLRALVARLDSLALPRDQWRRLDPEGATLIDIDRPQDLERLRAFDPAERGLP